MSQSIIIILLCFTLLPDLIRCQSRIQEQKVEEVKQQQHDGLYSYAKIKPGEPYPSFQIATSRLKISNHDAYMANITGGISNFHLFVRDSKCSLQKTSSFSHQFDCKYAVNGGPFNSYIRGGCVGTTISNGTIIQEDDGDFPVRDTSYGGGVEFASFGVTKNSPYSKSEWIVGNTNGYKNHTNIRELVTGLNLIIFSSNIVVNEKGGDRAPRTAIGIDKNGWNLILLQVDGCEHCKWGNDTRKGLTLYEMAEAMQLYSDYAINLDGGGSSTSVKEGDVLNHPTCLDYINKVCERPVASAVCITTNQLKLENESQNKILSQVTSIE